MMNKKDFQKVISKIRADYRKEENLPAAEYPKAMMTSQQAGNNTATVNCGGEWVSCVTSKKIAARVLGDERFQKLLRDNNATAILEHKYFSGATAGYQVRINY